MVAYSFRPRFVEPILAGTKRQTIRVERKRHARLGEELQLYTGMRTKHCRLIGKATCEGVYSVDLFLGKNGWIQTSLTKRFRDRDDFAKADGFDRWDDLVAFWRDAHPGIEEFHGTLITWGALHG